MTRQPVRTASKSQIIALLHQCHCVASAAARIGFYEPTLREFMRIYEINPADHLIKTSRASIIAVLQSCTSLAAAKKILKMDDGKFARRCNGLKIRNPQSHLQSASIATPHPKSQEERSDRRFCDIIAGRRFADFTIKSIAHCHATGPLIGVPVIDAHECAR